MANMCSNTATFHGDEGTVAKVKELFRTLRKNEEVDNAPQMPSFIDEDNGYFFNIYCEEDADATFHYETRWSPNTQILQLIAKEYNLGFEHDYEELGCLVYGRAVFEDGILSDTWLENEDFDTYAYDEDEDCYFFEGKEYESDWEILETLLERKLGKL